MVGGGKMRKVGFENDGYLDEYWTVSLDPGIVEKPLEFRLRTNRKRVERRRAA
jgi:hypothetical protein